MDNKLHEKRGANDYVIRLHDDPASLDRDAWDTLAASSPQAGPFTRHAYFDALHRSGSATPDTGWAPHFISVWRAGRMVAVCPLYLKSHSYGEYVFDWAWANAYEQHGLAYYPKLLDAVPFTPVPGPRLLAVDAEARAVLLGAVEQLADDSGVSSVHLLFIDEVERAELQAAGWMLRSTVQFHWENRAVQPFVDFQDFLAQLQREKRKKIQQERRRVAEAGIVFDVRRGGEIGEDDWDFFYRCYGSTYRAHHSSPYLTREFFRLMAQTMPEHWLLFVARRGSKRLASSLVAVDAERRRAYGRYWGCVEQVPCLHFEACYYQPLEWCIAQGWHGFEGGAQGEHKMARGLLPIQTWSAHRLSHPAFADAVARFLERERSGVEAYVDELRERNPFKAGEP
ncbi:GNAT family N-acetyltransferase [Aquabacterium sp. A7-Y]|uniref:GNAT family N-acetyltransferase n=1 Tax=Aquabacterium sp. A7-Y TaxID=1349605 RepID=UPI00223DCDEB|nr:GNAT family N-acetyltransferase [Aquabacterium sp. A7-Y]MCW7541501.1 GNAT family N-acetyltransferase [Aquabacterium sp. A7-Y]